MTFITRFPLSLRDVEEMMMARPRPQPGDKAHLDEVFHTINGRRQYRWWAVDQDGTVLDIRHCCIKAKGVPAMQQSGEARHLGHIEKLWQPDI